MCFCALRSLGMGGRLIERAAHGGAEPHQIGLEDVVDGALLERLDGTLLADGAGDEHERHLGRLGGGDGERVQAAELRQAEIGDDQAGLESRRARRAIALSVSTRRQVQGMPAARMRRISSSASVGTSSTTSIRNSGSIAPSVV